MRFADVPCDRTTNMKQRKFVVTVRNASSGIPFMAKYQDAEKMLTDIWYSENEVLHIYEMDEHDGTLSPIRWDMCKSRVVNGAAEAALFDANGVLLYTTVVV